MAIKLTSDNPASLWPTEQPQYVRLASAVGLAWRPVTAAYLQLRRAMFAAAGLDEPAKSVKNLNQGQERALDAAIEAFMRQMAGSDRSAEGFVSADSEDGLIQQAEYLAHSVGVGRAQALTGTMARNPQLEEAQRQALLRDAFSRLSEDGRLRFEDRLAEIGRTMVQGFRDGSNPLEIARQLGDNLDGYHQGRLRTIVRTEMAIASETAIIGGFREAGVSQYSVIGDPTTDEVCVNAQEGGPYNLSDADSLPPYHPNCFCSTVPI